MAALPFTLEAAIVGTGDVQPALPWSSHTTGYVGKTAYGSLTVDAGSSLASYYAYLGYESGAIGEVFVEGAGSKWTNSFNLLVGRYGSGTLNVADGGEVSSDFGYIASESGSHGTVTVSGAGSKWTNSSWLYVGSKRATGTLRITDGGQVSCTVGRIGYAYSSSQGTVTVRGAGSNWISSRELYVGGHGTGRLTVSDGGLVATDTLYAALADLHGNGTIVAKSAILDGDLHFDGAQAAQQSISFGTGGTLQFELDGTGWLGVGYRRTGTLTITGGATVASAAWLKWAVAPESLPMTAGCAYWREPQCHLALSTSPSPPGPGAAPART